MRSTLPNKKSLENFMGMAGAQPPPKDSIQNLPSTARNSIYIRAYFFFVYICTEQIVSSKLKIF